MVRGVIRCGKHESGAYTPRNPIGPLGTNENQSRWKQAFLNNRDAGNTNPGSKHIETTLVVQESCLRL